MSVRGKVLARRGEFGEAESMAIEAERIVKVTDLLSLHADVLMDKAEVLRAGGKLSEAVSTPLGQDLQNPSTCRQRSAADLSPAWGMSLAGKPHARLRILRRAELRRAADWPVCKPRNPNRLSRREDNLRAELRLDPGPEAKRPQRVARAPRPVDADDAGRLLRVVIPDAGDLQLVPVAETLSQPRHHLPPTTGLGSHDAAVIAVADCDCRGQNGQCRAEAPPVEGVDELHRDAHLFGLARTQCEGGRRI